MRPGHRHRPRRGRGDRQDLRPAPPDPRAGRRELARVLAPKVRGLVNLDALSRDLPLRAFVCFSSITGAFGNAGQGDYAAANA
ncbi:ketoreductase domain-containing protein, partial [Saccharothrix sp. ST-888]|uniref:ketoreductase domain-containing protein n=1 Tax=Saccharothrix sp. ST-888 TaxID=1427391 RepID=UPI0022B1E1C7